MKKPALAIDKFLILALVVVVAFVISFFTLSTVFYQSSLGMYGMSYSYYESIVQITAFIPAIIVGLAVAVVLEQKSKKIKKRRKK